LQKKRQSLQKFLETEKNQFVKQWVDDFINYIDKQLELEIVHEERNFY
jgi:hypothetical protein